MKFLLKKSSERSIFSYSEVPLEMKDEIVPIWFLFSSFNYLYQSLSYDIYPNKLKIPTSNFGFFVKIHSENLAVSLDTACILRRDFS
jgi:hypothetical protein